jgi:hypothetical protein
MDENILQRQLGICSKEDDKAVKTRSTAVFKIRNQIRQEHTKAIALSFISHGFQTSFMDFHGFLPPLVTS